MKKKKRRKKNKKKKQSNERRKGKRRKERRKQIQSLRLTTILFFFVRFFLVFSDLQLPKLSISSGRGGAHTRSLLWVQVEFQPCVSNIASRHLVLTSKRTATKLESSCKRMEPKGEKHEERCGRNSQLPCCPTAYNAFVMAWEPFPGLVSETSFSSPAPLCLFILFLFFYSRFAHKFSLLHLSSLFDPLKLLLLPLHSTPAPFQTLKKIVQEIRKSRGLRSRGFTSFFNSSVRTRTDLTARGCLDWYRKRIMIVSAFL